MTRPPPTSTLFPYTTLFQSGAVEQVVAEPAEQLVGAAEPDHVVLARAALEEVRPVGAHQQVGAGAAGEDRKSTRLNSSYANISYAVSCLKKNLISSLYDRIS